MILNKKEPIIYGTGFNVSQTLGVSGVEKFVAANITTLGQVVDLCGPQMDDAAALSESLHDSDPFPVESLDPDFRDRCGWFLEHSVSGPTSLADTGGKTLYKLLGKVICRDKLKVMFAPYYFSTFVPLGHFEYLVMPFDLTNAPAVFQALINDVLRDFLNRFIFVYLDDILIYSKTLTDHQLHVRQVLQRLLENQLFVKGKMRVPCLSGQLPQIHPGGGTGSSRFGEG
ncbi:hypothetical protein L3Q82_015691 [Scortum barcoo]|uniref:Uncharacterized protein n=1 Tax=Scortum barcoo TaxID=214431 RepID=A0ACB8VRV4_9TELE|nr:hypothetical protein L3Q82_015691 [Scortum barcoo]